MAIRRADPAARISLWTRREKSVATVNKHLPGCVVTTDLAHAVKGAEIVVLCTSPEAIEASGSKLAPLLSPDVVVTDAGSTKARIVARLEGDLGGRFIGAHPMAGSEQSGIAAARADLFDGSVCILTPTSRSEPTALLKAGELWKSAGCDLRELSPSVHDRIVARASHLPHAVAAALVHAANRDEAEIEEFVGNGYRDTTRIAGGPAGMWAEILLGNRAEVVNSVQDLMVELTNLKAFLESDDRGAVEAFLEEARVVRSSQRRQA